MEQRKSKMLAGTLAAAIVLGGGFAGTVNNAYAADTAAGQDGAAAAAGQGGAGAAADAKDTIAGVPVAVFAKLHGVDLRLGKAALSTAIIVNKDLEDVYDDLSAGLSLSQIGTHGASNFTSQLLQLTQSDIDSAVAAGNITAAQATQLSGYASQILNQEIGDANYRDNDNSSGDPVAAALLGDDTERADVAQFLGMPASDLFDTLASGKSLGVIAEGKGIGDDKLAAKLQEGLAAGLKPIVWNETKVPAAPAAPSAGDSNGGTAVPSAADSAAGSAVSQ